MKVAICICTYKRPKSLDKLLSALTEQTEVQDLDVKVIIVDNDVNKSAYNVVLKHQKNDLMKIEYYVEPKRGISYARNKAVKMALDSGVDFLAFIDDDEIPASKDWLAKLVSAQKESGADVIIGSVKPIFDSNVPHWILKSNFFEKPNAPVTANSLISSKVFYSLGKHFDPKFALTGGSDTHFFLRLTKLGFKTIRISDIVVEEEIPMSRANAKWILKRAFRTGCTASMIDIDLNGNKAIFKRIIIALVRLTQGIFSFPIFLLKGKQGVVKSLWYIYKGFGVLYGLIGGRYLEYKEVHGK